MILSIALEVGIRASDDDDNERVERFQAIIDEFALEEGWPAATLDESLFNDVCEKLRDLRQIVARAKASVPQKGIDDE